MAGETVLTQVRDRVAYLTLNRPEKLNALTVASMDELLAADYIDIFRRLHPEPGRYTWWTHRNQARQRNVGWRIDYYFVTPALMPHIVAADHLPEVLGSDHCPIELRLDLGADSRSNQAVGARISPSA